ncbi:MAG: hypothetical protein IPM51_01935 [Sphingobacteriaceae bacterium]|nr:hypothetical protein [Sphingobacteriaceae bacterium]
MSFCPEIKLLKGFCNLSFGEPAEIIKKTFGEPEEVQELNDDILNTSSTVYHYWEMGFSLFFDNHKNQSFNSAEIDNKETLLFGVKLFDLKEKEIVELMKKNGFSLSDSENHDWGEKRLSFDEAGLDCYFQNQKLASVNFGVGDKADEFYYFPN